MVYSRLCKWNYLHAVSHATVTFYKITSQVYDIKNHPTYALNQDIKDVAMCPTKDNA